jgi:hypothetical protein
MKDEEDLVQSMDELDDSEDDFVIGGKKKRKD